MQASLIESIEYYTTPILTRAVQWIRIATGTTRAKSDTIAQRRFDVAKDRYLIGKIDIPNLFLAQSEKDSAWRANIQTLREYWVSYFRIRALTLHDFDIGKTLLNGKL